MTDIEKKALALLNERHSPYEYAPDDHPVRVLARAIEQHEAFRQEVSDAVEGVFLLTKPMRSESDVLEGVLHDYLNRFIIAKPDPLVEDFGHDLAADIRAAIEKRGGKIVWGEG